MELSDGAYDLRTLEILGLRHMVGLTDEEILRWYWARVAVRLGHYSDQTLEQFRLEFWKRERDLGRLTDGMPTAETLAQVAQGLDVAGAAAQQQPEYSGGGSAPVRESWNEVE